MATAKKLTRAKISSLSIAGKALSENIVFERVSREAGTNFGYYFESCSLTSPVEQLESSVLFRGFVKRCSDTFFDLFSERATGSQDKYALMQVRWYEFFREMLISQEVCDMVKEMASGKDVVSCYLESVLIAGFKFVRERQEDSQSSRFDVTTVNMNIVEDDVSLLKLGSAAVLKLKKRLHQIARPLSKSKQSLKNIVLKEIEALERMEDLEKKNIPCFIRNLDDGNLLVVNSELLAFLQAFAKVFGSVVNQNGYSSHGRTIFKVAEQQVMFDSGLKRKFFEALVYLGIQIPPSIRCDLYKRLLHKMYNIRCNEFVRSQKCLEEHENKKNSRQTSYVEA